MPVSIVKINAITVPAESGDELGRRFAARAGAVDDQDGFEGFELLKPTDGRTTWLVVTRWRDEAAFEAWVSSPAFGHGHRGAGGGPGGSPSGGADAEGAGGRPEGSGADAGTAQASPPAGMSSELWSFEPTVASPGNG